MKKSNFLFWFLSTVIISLNHSCGKDADFEKHEIDYGTPDSRYHPPEWIQGTWISPLSSSYIYVYTFLSDNILESQGKTFVGAKGNSEIIGFDDIGQKYYEINNRINNENIRFTFISNNQLRYSYITSTLTVEAYLYLAISEEIEHVK